MSSRLDVTDRHRPQGGQIGKTPSNQLEYAPYLPIYQSRLSLTFVLGSFN